MRAMRPLRARVDRLNACWTFQASGGARGECGLRSAIDGGTQSWTGATSAKLLATITATEAPGGTVPVTPYPKAAHIAAHGRSCWDGASPLLEPSCVHNTADAA